MRGLHLWKSVKLMPYDDGHVQAVDFLDKLLRYDHQDRLTAREAMVSFGWVVLHVCSLLLVRWWSVCSGV